MLKENFVFKHKDDKETLFTAVYKNEDKKFVITFNDGFEELKALYEKEEVEKYLKNKTWIEVK